MYVGERFVRNRARATELAPESDQGLLPVCHLRVLVVQRGDGCFAHADSSSDFHVRVPFEGASVLKGGDENQELSVLVSQLGAKPDRRSQRAGMCGDRRLWSSTSNGRSI